MQNELVKATHYVNVSVFLGVILMMLYLFSEIIIGVFNSEDALYIVSRGFAVYLLYFFILLVVLPASRKSKTAYDNLKFGNLNKMQNTDYKKDRNTEQSLSVDIDRIDSILKDLEEDRLYSAINVLSRWKGSLEQDINDLYL